MQLEEVVQVDTNLSKCCSYLKQNAEFLTFLS